MESGPKNKDEEELAPERQSYRPFFLSPLLRRGTPKGKEDRKKEKGEDEALFDASLPAITRGVRSEHRKHDRPGEGGGEKKKKKGKRPKTANASPLYLPKPEGEKGDRKEKKKKIGRSAQGLSILALGYDLDNLEGKDGEGKEKKKKRKVGAGHGHVLVYHAAVAPFSGGKKGRFEKKEGGK